MGPMASSQTSIFSSDIHISLAPIRPLTVLVPPRLIVRLPAIPPFISLLRHPLGSCTCMGAHPSQPPALHILTPVSFQIHCLIQRSWYRMGEEGHICLVCLGHIALLSLAMEVRSTQSDDYHALSILLCPIDGGRGHELDPLNAGKSRGFLLSA